MSYDVKVPAEINFIESGIDDREVLSNSLNDCFFDVEMKKGFVQKC